MSSMFFLTLVIVLVSGLIAYVGDLIGRKLGRKRLTLFGLRPRYTAIVISIGIGMLIAALTLAATFVVNKRVREAFFTPLEKLRAEISSSRERASLAEKQLSVKTRELNETDYMLHHSKTRQQEIQNQLTLAQGNLSKEQQKLHNTQRRLDLVDAQLTRINEKLAKANQRLVVAQAEYTRVRNDYQHTKESLSSTNKLLLAKTTELITGQDELSKLQYEIANLRKEQSELERRNTELRTALGEFVLTSFAPLTFERGQEIVSAIFISTGTINTEREKQLADFLAVAEQIVRQHSPQMPKDESALLFYKAGTETEDKLEPLTKQEAINILSKRIESLHSTEKILLRLTPANNVRVNGPAIIFADHIELVPNDVIYPAGSEVASVEMNITPQTTNAEIMGNLVDKLLRERVPEALHNRQVAMIVRRFDPQHPDDIPAPTPSIVPWSDLFVAAEQVREQSGKVTVVARTHTTLHRFDPLDLSLDVVSARKQ